jgi:hypothetical protein
MDDKAIKQLWRSARQELFTSNYVLEKCSFEMLIDGMILKIHQKYNKGGNTNKTPKAEETLQKLDQMKHFLEKLSFKNCISHFQAKIIVAQDRRILLLENDKRELIEELEKLKKNILLNS